MSAMLSGFDMASSPSMTAFTVTELATKLVGKVLVRQSWHKGRCYYARVKKKWAKRFGPPRREPCVLMTKTHMYIHPDVYAKIKAGG